MKMKQIIPLNDSKEHTPDSTCDCCPWITPLAGGEYAIIHQRFDGDDEERGNNPPPDEEGDILEEV